MKTHFVSHSLRGKVTGLTKKNVDIRIECNDQSIDFSVPLLLITQGSHRINTGDRVELSCTGIFHPADKPAKTNSHSRQLTLA